MTCRVDGCQFPVRARGVCSTHYERGRRYGDWNNLERRRPYDRLDIVEVTRLLQAGVSGTRIARQFGVSKDAVYRAIRRGGTQPELDLSWHENAACRDADHRLFLANAPGPMAEQALAYCAHCPVIDQCGLSRGDADGVFGGALYGRNGHPVPVSVENAWTDCDSQESLDLQEKIAAVKEAS